MEIDADEHNKSLLLHLEGEIEDENMEMGITTVPAANLISASAAELKEGQGSREKPLFFLRRGDISLIPSERAFRASQRDDVCAFLNG